MCSASRHLSKRGLLPSSTDSYLSMREIPDYIANMNIIARNKRFHLRWFTVVKRRKAFAFILMITFSFTQSIWPSQVIASVLMWFIGLFYCRLSVICPTRNINMCECGIYVYLLYLHHNTLKNSCIWHLALNFVYNVSPIYGPIYLTSEKTICHINVNKIIQSQVNKIY